jgi:ketosteroid isomerase-like protein
MMKEDRFTAAFNAADVDAIMKVYVPDESLLVFDVVPPRQYLGANAYRKDWVDFFAMFKGPPKIDITDLGITAEGNLGFSHSIQRVRGTDTEQSSGIVSTMSAAAAFISAVLNTPGTRAERPKSIFHGALMMPDTRLRVSVGKKAQNFPVLSSDESRRTAQMSGTSWMSFLPWSAPASLRMASVIGISHRARLYGSRDARDDGTWALWNGNLTNLRRPILEMSSVNGNEIRHSIMIDFPTLKERRVNRLHNILRVRR